MGHINTLQKSIVDSLSKATSAEGFVAQVKHYKKLSDNSSYCSVPQPRSGKVSTKEDLWTVKRRPPHSLPQLQSCLLPFLSLINGLTIHGWALSLCFIKNQWLFLPSKFYNEETSNRTAENVQESTAHQDTMPTILQPALLKMKDTSYVLVTPRTMHNSPMSRYCSVSPTVLTAFSELTHAAAAVLMLQPSLLWLRATVP